MFKPVIYGLYHTTLYYQLLIASGADKHTDKHTELPDFKKLNMNQSQAGIYNSYIPGLKIYYVQHIRSTNCAAMQLY